MKFEYNDTKLGAIIGFTDDIKNNLNRFSDTSKTIKFLWNRNQEPMNLLVDDMPIQLEPGQLMTVTYLHHVSYDLLKLPLTSILFNREFYCISDHDSEVSCNGILFFGTQEIPIVTIPEEQQRKFDLWFDVFQEEFSTPDNIQGDMLQMLLKRLIIMCTRLAKEQHIVKSLNKRANRHY